MTLRSGAGTTATGARRREHERVNEVAVAVMVVDDQRAFRSAAASVVELTDGFTLVAEAASGEQAVRLAAERDVDLVLMDVNMPGIGGVEAAEAICGSDDGVVVVLVSTYEPSDLPADVHSSGRPYLHKERLDPDVLRALWTERRSAGDR
jgi:two-component system, NarL family, invasion response regulator UvrY